MDTIRGKTTIYGDLTTIEADNLHVTTIQGFQLEIPARGEILNILADRIGEEIGLTGTATYNFDDMAIVAFEVDGVLPYRKTSLSEALAALRDAIVGAYDWFETEKDIDDYVKWIRGTEDEAINERFDDMYRK